MRAGVLAAVKSGQVTVHIDKVDTTAKASIALTVEGHLDGLPKYIEPSPGSALTLDAAGLPVKSSTRTAPFRVVVPAGRADYRFVMYGHGTGGRYDESTFDTEIASGGAAKVGVQFDGWTESDVIQTFLGFLTIFQGTHYAGAMLMQALSDAAAIQVMLPGALGDALAAPMIGGVPNPAAGRHPDPQQSLWVGGSLGGILGLVAVCADPAMRYAVLNVPGAAWTHYIPKSVMFSMLSSVLKSSYHSEVDALHALAMSQGNWDEIDGAAWSSALTGRDAAFLIQESIGDPVVPNAGSEMVAVVTSATQRGAGPDRSEAAAGRCGRRCERDHPVPHPLHRAARDPRLRRLRLCGWSRRADPGHRLCHHNLDDGPPQDHRPRWLHRRKLRLQRGAALRSCERSPFLD